MNKEQYEYKILTISRGTLTGGTTDTEWESKMNELGKEGWELIGLTSMSIIPLVECIFKRVL